MFVLVQTDKSFSEWLFSYTSKRLCLLRLEHKDPKRRGGEEEDKSGRYEPV